MDERDNIRRWNLSKPVYEVSAGLLIRSMLGYNRYTYKQIDTLLDYPELYDLGITSTTRYTISINDEKRCIVLQKVPTHGGGRDTTILYERGIPRVIDGKNYIHKNKR